MFIAVSRSSSFSPTDPFTTLELQNLHEISRSPDFEALKLRKSLLLLFFGFPIGPFANLKPRDLEIGEFYGVRER